MEILQTIEHTMELVEQFTSELGCPISKSDYIIEDLGCPHKPTPLKPEYVGVYLFFYKGKALKIGKANERTKARFLSQHYGFNARSTLAKSIAADPYFAQLGFTKENAGAWIKENTHRINILVTERIGPAASELIEAVFHYQFRPRFEGALQTKY